MAARSKALVSWCLSISVEQRLARGRHHRPEGDARRAAGGNPQAPAQREHRIEHGADGVGQAPAVDHGDGVADVVAAAEEARAIGLELDLAKRLALDDREMGGPQLGLARAAAAARRQDGAGVRPGTRSRTKSLEKAWCAESASGGASTISA